MLMPAVLAALHNRYQFFPFSDARLIYVVIDSDINMKSSIPNYEAGRLIYVDVDNINNMTCSVST